MNEFGSIIEPPTVPFRFGAPGWYVLAALILLLLGSATILSVKYYQRNSYRRQALRWLQARETALLPNGAIAQLVYEINMVLKGIAMRRYGRRQVAALGGRQWITMLNKTMKRPLFDDRDEILLTQRIYQSPAGIPPDDAADFAIKSKTWIQRHRYHYAL